MKELHTILEAMIRARSILGSYENGDERDLHNMLKRLTAVLDDDDLRCALEKIQQSIGSPPLAPELEDHRSRRFDH